MSNEHRDLLHKYLRFFRHKRESVLKEVTLTLKDAKKEYIYYIISIYYLVWTQIYIAKKT